MGTWIVHNFNYFGFGYSFVAAFFFFVVSLGLHGFKHLLWILFFFVLNSNFQQWKTAYANISSTYYYKLILEHKISTKNSKLPNMTNPNLKHTKSDFMHVRWYDHNSVCDIDYERKKKLFFNVNNKSAPIFEEI